MIAIECPCEALADDWSQIKGKRTQDVCANRRKAGARRREKREQFSAAITACVRAADAGESVQPMESAVHPAKVLPYCPGQNFSKCDTQTNCLNICHRWALT